MAMTFDPILESKVFECGWFTKVPIAAQETALILSAQSKSTPLFEITEDKNPEAREVRKKGCGWQTTIDLSEHTIDVVMEVKAKDRISRFLVALQMVTKVINPTLIYKENVRDMSAFVKENLEGAVEEISCGFDIQEEAAFKQNLRDWLKAYLQFDGLEIKVKNVTVDFDKEAGEHFRALRNTDWDKEKHMKKQEAAKQIGEGLGGDVGALMEILDGKRPVSEITEVRRQLRKNEFSDVFEEVMKKVEFLNQMVENNTISELARETAMKELIPTLMIGNQELHAAELLGTQDGNEFASFDEGEKP